MLLHQTKLLGLEGQANTNLYGSLGQPKAGHQRKLFAAHGLDMNGKRPERERLEETRDAMRRGRLTNWVKDNHHLQAQLGPGPLGAIRQRGQDKAFVCG